MLNKFSGRYLPKFPLIRRGKKSFFFLAAVIVLLILSAFIFPVIKQNIISNWEGRLSAKIQKIESETGDILKNKEDVLLSASSGFKKELKHTLHPGNRSYEGLISLVNEQKYKKFSVEVVAPNGKIIAWNNRVAIPQEDFFPLTYPAGETYFYRSGIVTFFTVTDTFSVEGDQFYFAVSQPIEKHYILLNPFYNEISFAKELADNFFTQFDIDYHPFSQPVRDGRKYSFELVNNKNNKIGLVTFTKPLLDTELRSFTETAGIIQSLLVIAGILFLTFGLRNDFKSLRFRSLKLLFIVVYLSLLRYVLLAVDFPSAILKGELTEPSFFSSAFGEGIVKSPAEFCVSSIFVLLICLAAFNYFVSYLKENFNREKQFPVFVYLIAPPFIIFFLSTLRGLNSAIKSVINDSSIRYFREPDLIPGLPALVMNFSILMLATGIVLLLCCYMLIIISFFKKGRGKKPFYILYLSVLTSMLLFIVIVGEPLLTPLLGLAIITFIFLLVYQVYYGNIYSVYNYVYAAIVASVISISMLNHFNLQLEKNSLKTTALEVNRPNEGLLRFLLLESLQNASKEKEVTGSFIRQNTNFNSIAFEIWSASSLHKESLTSEVIVLDKNKTLLGSFSVGTAIPVDWFKQIDLNSTEITELEPEARGQGISFAGIMPVTERGVTLGYVAAYVKFSLENLGAANIPDFLESKKNIFNSILDINQLKIFQIRDGQLAHFFGDIYPSKEQIDPIVNAKFNEENEAWITLSLSGEEYLIYALRNITPHKVEKITAVLLREKHFTWDLFNFFKIFILHSVYIVALALLLFTVKVRKIKYSFRTQLLTAFLFISIVPVLILAAYNRQIVNSRTEAAIFNELNERANLLEFHIKAQTAKGVDFDQALRNAGEESGISFTLYNGSNLIYSSKEQYYKSGIFQQKLNSETYYQMFYMSYREFLTRERVNNFMFNSFYKKIFIGENTYIIGVNDALNKFRISYSTIDVDVFLFGIYSFALILIIIVSTIIANKISEPIRRLTKATNSVAHGDLNVHIDNNERGELKELLNGFNMMTKELQKNQSELAMLERENAWKEMAKQVAHEIKNPLTPMKLAVQQMIASFREKKNFEEMFEKVSSTILKQIENLSVIASEFSRFARMPNFKIENINLVELISDTVNLFMDERVKIEFNSGVPLADSEGDAAQFRRMLINLVRNSIQAESSVIRISLSPEENYYSLLIQDNGRGMPENVQPRIFESGFTTKEQGMGIGLKLAQRYLESINGKIELVNSSSGGTLFRILLPKN